MVPRLHLAPPLLPPPPEIPPEENPQPLAIPNADDPPPPVQNAAPSHMMDSDIPQELDEPDEIDNRQPGIPERAPALSENAPLLLQTNTPTHNNNNNNNSTSSPVVPPGQSDQEVSNASTPATAPAPAPTRDNPEHTNTTEPNSLAGSHLNSAATSVTAITERLRSTHRRGRRHNPSSADEAIQTNGLKRKQSSSSSSPARNDPENVTVGERDVINDDGIVNEHEKEEEEEEKEEEKEREREEEEKEREKEDEERTEGN